MRARDNPFAVSRLDGICYRFPEGRSLGGLLERLREQGGRGALVGGEGRGKSTLLGELAERLIRDGFTVRRITLRQGESRVPAGSLPGPASLDESTALLVDGAEQLSSLAWIALRWRVRRAGILVVTAHCEGLLPTLLRCETSPEILRDLLDELAPERPAGFPTARELWARHGEDVRQALFEAYDRWGEGLEVPKG